MRTFQRRSNREKTRNGNKFFEINRNWILRGFLRKFLRFLVRNWLKIKSKTIFALFSNYFDKKSAKNRAKNRPKGKKRETAARRVADRYGRTRFACVAFRCETHAAPQIPPLSCRLGGRSRAFEWGWENEGKRRKRRHLVLQNCFFNRKIQFRQFSAPETI